MLTTRCATALFALLLPLLTGAGAVPTGAESGAGAGPAAGPLQEPTGRQSARNGRIVQATSSNWSGYAVSGGRYSSVAAHWVQPAAHCTRTTSYASFWIGLDGDGSHSVEQTGTETDCSGGTPMSYAWYEMYPAYPVAFTHPVRPGDRISASVTGTAAGAFTLVLSDATGHWSETVRRNLPGATRASAEVIAEAPSGSAGVLPLTDFGTASFTGASVNGRPLAALATERITMTAGPTVLATTSALARGGNFAVTWRRG